MMYPGLASWAKFISNRLWQTQPRKEMTSHHKSRKAYLSIPTSGLPVFIRRVEVPICLLHFEPTWLGAQEMDRWPKERRFRHRVM